MIAALAAVSQAPIGEARERNDGPRETDDKSL